MSKKKIVALLLTVLVILSCGMTALAAGANQSVIDQAKKDYDAAKAKGDKAGMEAAHAAAEAERAKDGYSGGDDGSQRISTKSSSSSSSGSKGSSSSSSSSNKNTTSTVNINKTTQQMTENSAAWFVADNAERAARLQGQCMMMIS